MTIAFAGRGGAVEIKQSKRERKCEMCVWGRGHGVLLTAVEEVTSEQRLREMKEGAMRISDGRVIWAKDAANARGWMRLEAARAGMSLTYQRRSTEASVARAERERGNIGGEETKEALGPEFIGFVGSYKASGNRAPISAFIFTSSSSVSLCPLFS